MTQLEYLLTEFGFTSRTHEHRTQISEIEQLIGFSLPDDYKLFLENYDGCEGMIGAQYVAIWEIDEMLAMNKIYKIQEWLPSTLAVGSNMGGDFVGIEFIGDTHHIILSPFICVNTADYIEIGKSFTGFFVRLYEGKQWFG